MFRVICNGALAAVIAFALFVSEEQRESIAADPVDEGCPASSTPVGQTGDTLKTFSEDTDLGVVFDDINAHLELKKEGGNFTSTSFDMASKVQYACGGDFDEDGWVDFIGGDADGKYLAFYKNYTEENQLPPNPAPDWGNPSYRTAPKFLRVGQASDSDSTGGVWIEYNVSQNSGAGAATCGDFDGDGHMDFIYILRNSNYGSPARADMFLGNGDGTFKAKYKAVSNFSDMANMSWDMQYDTTDYNGDGFLDLIYGGHNDSIGSGGFVRVFLNDGDPSQPKLVPGPYLITDANMGSRGVVALAHDDYTGDGVADLVITGNTVSKVHLYPGLAGGGLDSANMQDITDNFPTGGTLVMSADFSLDGNLDVVVGTNGNGGRVFWWKNDGTGSPFSNGTETELPTPYSDLDTGFIIDYDHDPDGTVDFVIADGNHAAGYLVFANRVITTYVACGEVASGVLDLGTLADEEMVVTAARLNPTMVLPGGTSIEFYMSNQEPPVWELASPCSDDPSNYCVTFSKATGREVRWKAVMCTTDNTTTPTISGIDFGFDFTEAETHFRAGVVVHDGIAYVGAFRQPGERGRFFALAAGSDAGSVTEYWEVSTRLDAVADSSRAMYTTTTDGATRLDWEEGNSSEATELRATLGTATDAQTNSVIAWQRSKRFGVGNLGIPLSRLGAVQTSTPAVVSHPVRPVWYNFATSGQKTKIDSFVTSNANRTQIVLFGSKDGPLHAIFTNPINTGDTRNGQELWAFVPPTVATGMLADMTNDTSANYVDGSPTVADVFFSAGEVHTVALVGGGKGGDSIVGLDITDTEDPKPLWTVTPGGVTAGQAFSKPVVIRVQIDLTERHLAIFGTGVDSSDPTKGRDLVAVDVETGTSLWTFRTACPLTSDLTAFETNDDLEPGDPVHDGYIDRVVFADWCGNMYKLDPAQDQSGATAVALGDLSVDVDGSPVAVLFSNTDTTNARGEPRPIAGTIGARVDNTDRLVLFFGTGGIESYDVTKQNDFYAVYADDGTIRSSLAGECLGAPDNRCEKFYGGVLITTDQVLITRSFDPPVGTAACDFGDTVLAGFNLNDVDSDGAFDQQFSVALSSSVVTALYGDGGAVYTASLGGDLIRIGTPRATEAGGDTASPPPTEGDPGEGGGGIVIEALFNIWGWWPGL